MVSSTFEKHVALKYNLYNSLFLTLPIDGISRTGIRLPLLEEHCRKQLEAGLNPTEIMQSFFNDQPDLKNDQLQIDFMFRIIQYVERQIVLIDALEDSAYADINDLHGTDSFKHLVDQITKEDRMQELKTALEDFSARIVLTAHPTQFYPGEILAIINDLADAIDHNRLEDIRMLLQQLGKTPFFKKEKPTPLGEAMSLIWFLENVFYQSAPELIHKIMTLTHHTTGELKNHNVLSFGFWPGGDRDGNPFVDVATTKRVAEQLKFSIIRNYYREIRQLRRRLSFRGVLGKLKKLEKKLFTHLTTNKKTELTIEYVLDKLHEIRSILVDRHDGLFEHLVTQMINKINLFGFHFASIDIRQDSRVIKSTIARVYETNEGIAQSEIASQLLDQQFDMIALQNGGHALEGVERDTYEVFQTMQTIQDRNGTRGCHRFIISNCRNEIDISNVFALAKMNGWTDPMPIDIVPLFETIDDLKRAGETMRILYRHPVYRRHLESRNLRQTIMLGFSDGTKDGGFLAANWGIYRAKEDLTAVSRDEGIEVVFFDGRGGPPARGGGNTYKFYASLGQEIENKEIQLTIQGQTISSKFGTPVSSAHNIELLMSAGLENQLVADETKILHPDERKLLEELAELSYQEYQRFKQHEKFTPYLEKMSALKYYAMANIGSRPSKRTASKELRFEDLRAIPFVGAWSQLKQNVPGFFGVGSALQEMEKAGRLDECRSLYHHNAFFRALIDNSMMSMIKTSFPLTAYMKDDQEFGSFWSWIYQEFQIAKEMSLKVSGQKELLETNPIGRESIELRERITLPLVIIQQYALMRIRKMDLLGKTDDKLYDVLQKLVVRSMYGNINASRNSA